MSDYSYSKEINQNSVIFYELNLEKVRKMFTKIFDTYSTRVKPEVFDSFCEDFYELASAIHGSNERIWRMIITDMFFSYDDRGLLEVTASDNSIKRKQFAIISNVIVTRLQATG